MRNILFFLIAFTATVISSCFPCEDVECDDTPPYMYFVLVNATGQDLVFGPNNIYDRNRFTFYALTATDSTFYDYRIVETGDQRFESALRVLFDPIQEVAYMKLSDGDIDTLNISYTSTETACCGTSFEITHFHHNDSDDISADTGFQVLQK